MSEEALANLIFKVHAMGKLIITLQEQRRGLELRVRVLENHVLLVNGTAPRPHPPADLEPLDFFEKGGG